MKCNKCQSENNVKAGIEIQVKGKFQRRKCKDCGHVMIGERIINVG
jgi:transposase-like protein